MLCHIQLHVALSYPLHPLESGFETGSSFFQRSFLFCFQFFIHSILFRLELLSESYFELVQFSLVFKE